MDSSSIPIAGQAACRSQVPVHKAKATKSADVNGDLVAPLNPFGSQIILCQKRLILSQVKVTREESITQKYNGGSVVF